MHDALGIALLSVAFVAAIACGFSLWRAFEDWQRLKRHRNSLASPRLDGSASVESKGDSPDGLSGKVASYMERLTREMAMGRKGGIARRFTAAMRRSASKQVFSMLVLAGLEGKVSIQAYCEARARLAIASAVAGFVLGMLFSFGLATVLAIAGVLIGWKLPGYALQALASTRANETERHLPEMLDVVALGMRSGLSFDASLKIYAEHFDTALARELENARLQWSSGLARRDEALRKLASTYDSAVFGRVVETIVRSIRYGSSMVASLEADAAEARSAYQSQREERIAKAPVKMMVPTGVLILPAMLIMVLGPVLLELAGGGI